MNWTTISVNALAQELGIPVATLRRYMRQYAHFLDMTKTDKKYRISEQSIGVLNRIREGFSKGWSSEEVENDLLASGIQRVSNVTVESVKEQGSADVGEVLLNLQKLIVERFEQQEQILKTLAEIAPTLQQLDPEMQRVERVNSRLNEWRMERKLESEALTKWAELPQDERMMRTGLFKTEENVEKRERFVREYVDKHFDEEMRHAYGS